MNSVNLGSGVHFFQEYGADNFIIEKPHMPFHLGGRVEAIRLVKAILAALGEPGGQKPDRSELDKEEPWRWLVVESESGKKIERWMPSARIDDMISTISNRTGVAFTLYEAVAHVAAEPKPAERKVVRLD